MKVILSILLLGCFLLNPYYAQGYSDEQIAFLQEALKIDPDNFGIYYGLGIAYYKANQYDKVIECHQKFIRLIDYPQAYRNLERAYRKIGDDSKAKEYAQMAREHEKDNERLSLPVSSRARDSREIEALSKLLQINPGIGALYANLGGQDTIKKEDVDKEVKYLQRALEIDPENFGIYYGLGIAYYRVEEYDKTIEYCLKFTQANPGCGLTYYTLGVVYYNSGDSTNALEQVKELRRVSLFELADKLQALISGRPYQGADEEKRQQDLKEAVNKIKELEEQLPYDFE